MEGVGKEDHRGPDCSRVEGDPLACGCSVRFVIAAPPVGESFNPVGGLGSRHWMGIIGWIVLGLLVGAIARAVVPGRTEPSGCIGTTAVGILGALIGGFIASALDIGQVSDFFDVGTWLIAIGGSVLLLLLFRAIAGPPGR